MGAADLHIMNVVDADRLNNSHFDIPYRIYLLIMFYSRRKSIHTMGVDTV